MNQHTLSGIYSALLTPLDSQRNVDEASLRRLIRFNLQHGVDGLYVGGSSGEAFLLNLEERQQIMEVAAQELKEQGRLIAHVGCISTRDSVELARHAAELGADAISAVSPFYYGFRFSEIVDHYRAIIDAAGGTPMVVYNFPAMSGVNLSLDQISTLLELPQVIGLKQTSADLYQMEQIRARHPDKVLFNGFDEIFTSGQLAGANGGIGSTYNLMGWRYLDIQKSLLANNIERAKKLQSSCNRVIDRLITAGVFSGLKEMLCHLGVIDTPFCRQPFHGVDSALKEELHTLAFELNAQRGI
ncbi:N-acetylneuraminate lyase [Dongshaea marina]|uniref:N-acetylneuraminate lyase n=1 Tax=Dongshaea marina TaxID=2047966 RepID=UPI000D3E1021|nr:N-acetylneuraminate lyase [Dongshaea marina]